MISANYVDKDNNMVSGDEVKIVDQISKTERFAKKNSYISYLSTFKSCLPSQNRRAIVVSSVGKFRYKKFSFLLDTNTAMSLHTAEREPNNWTTIDKVYRDRPYGSKTLTGILLERFERVSHETHFYTF